MNTKWTWTDGTRQMANRQLDGGFFECCGVNTEPLMSWLAEGNEPEEWTPETATDEVTE